MKYAIVLVLSVLVLIAGWYAPKYWDVYLACADIRAMSNSTIILDPVVKSADDFMLRKCDEALGPFF